MRVLEFCSVTPLLLGSVLAALAGPARAAAPVVQVELWDKGADSLSVSGHGFPGGDPAGASMGLKISPSTVDAGDVAFEVENASKEMIHEMVIVPAPAAGKDLPYDQAFGRFDEDAAGHLGEVSELEPGQSGALRLNLKPGTYLLICNIPGHYMAGMWAALTVK